MAGRQNQRFHPYQGAGNHAGNANQSQNNDGPGFNVFAHFFPDLYGAPGQPKRVEPSFKKRKGKKPRDYPGAELEVKLTGMPRNYALAELKRIFTKLELNVKVKPSGRFLPFRSPSWVWLKFESVEEKEQGVLVLHGYRWKNCTLHVSGEMPSRKPVIKFFKTLKRLNANQRVIKSEFESQEEAVKYAHIPLWDISYEEQLTEKAERAKNVLKALCSEMLIEEERKFRPVVPEILDYAKKQSEKFDGMPCEFVGMLPAPRLEGYRQRCEFTIGLDANNEKTVGLEARYPKDARIVAPVIPELVSLPQKMKETVWTFQKFIRSSSYDVYDYKTNKGHWRTFTVRTGFAVNKTLIMIHAHPQDLTPEQLEAVKASIVEFYTTGEGKQNPPSSIYFQLLTKKSQIWDKTTLTHIFGEKSFLDKACGRIFDLVPPATFLLNMSAADIIYKWAGDLARVDKTTTLLDIYREVGLTGLILAPRAGEVLGLDIGASSDEAGVENAKRNNVTNCRHFFGPPETQLAHVLAEAKFNKIVATIDAPRTGLQPLVITQLRQAEKVQRIVFMSSHHGVFENFTSLTYPPTKTFPGNPFVPVKAVTLDYLPHSFSYRFMVLFERIAISPVVKEEVKVEVKEEN